MKTLLRDADGESLVWWNWQNLAKPGQHRNARAWLHFYDNSIGVQWVFRPRNLSLGITFADTTVDDDSLSFHFSIPFLLALYVSIARIPIVKRLPGVKYVSGQHDSGMRSISFAYDRRENNWVHWRLWRNPHFGKSRDWRDDGLFIDDVIYGSDKYSEIDSSSGNPIAKTEATAAYNCWVDRQGRFDASQTYVMPDLIMGVDDAIADLKRGKLVIVGINHIEKVRRRIEIEERDE